MSSGSLKDLTRSLNTTLATPASPKPTDGTYKSTELPSELSQTIQSYLDKHQGIDDADSQRLHEELLAVHQKHVAGNASNLAAFLQALCLLQPLIKGQSRLDEWWDIAIEPVINAIGHKRVEIEYATDFVLAALDYDADADSTGDRAKTSSHLVKKLLDAYLRRTKLPNPDSEALTLEDEYIARQLESVLTTYGRKKPKDFMQAIDRLVVEKAHRMQALGLLSAFARHQPPHLYLVSQTSLIEHLLKCLMIDTSSTVISLALACLIMFLPHIPSSVRAHLPRLFLIYSRILCWERFFPTTPTGDNEATDGNDGGEGEDEGATQTPEEDEGWEKLESSFDAAESTAPELIHYFTFLYGLYPLNFTSYIRKPRRYLKDINFPRAKDFDLDQSIIRSRTEQFRRVHLVHPNFYTTTAEDELTDNRWLKSDPSDVVSECMNLYIAAPEATQETAHRPAPEVAPHTLSTEDIPHQSLLENDDDTPLLSRPAEALRPDAMSTSPAGSSNTGTRTSYPSQDTPSTRSPAASSPAVGPLSDFAGSPTTPSARSQTLPYVHPPYRQDSISSKQSVSNASPRIGPASRSLMPRSPAVRPASQGEANMAFLQREIMLLRNDLNFERYLKQQHLTHIGQLQRRHITEATAEAETQNLINTNRALKAKVAKANDTYAALKKETATSRNQSKKWEAELSARVRSLREDEKRWLADAETLRVELDQAKTDCDHLRQLVVESESKELLAQQELSFAQIKLERLDDLQARVAELEAKIRQYEAKDLLYLQSDDEVDALRQELAAANLLIQAQDASQERVGREFDRIIRELEARLHAAQNPTAGGPNGELAPHVKALLDAAVAGAVGTNGK